MAGWIKLAVGGLLFLAPLWIGLPHYLEFEGRRNAKVHLVEYTRQDLRNVTLGLLTMFELERRQPWNVAEAERAVSGRELFKQLSQSPEALRLARPTDTSKSHTSFCDRWGSEIHARISLRGGQMHVVLWSNGPNLNDELGSGDDIVEVCDLTIPRAEDLAHP